MKSIGKTEPIMIKVGLFAYGQTAYAAFTSLIEKFHIIWIVIPANPEYILDESKLRKIEQIAKKKKIKVIESDSTNIIFREIKKNTPDIVVISTYSKILPKKILSLTKYINIHHGDLPSYRGRANINWAIINGRNKIGLTFHEATVDLDAGNIYEQYIVPIKDTDTVKIIYKKFNKLITQHIPEIVEKVYRGDIGKPQIGGATYCCTRLPEDGYIDWSKSSKEIYNLIRALTNPYPGAFTYLGEDKITIWNAEMPEKPLSYVGRIPGRVIKIISTVGVEVLTGDSSIIIKDIEYKNKKINASKVITSTKKTLGLSIQVLFEAMRYSLRNKKT